MPNPHDTSLTLAELFDRCTVLLNSGESPHASTGVYKLDRCNGDCLSLTLETEDSEAAAQMEDIRDELPTPKGKQTPADQVKALLGRIEDLEDALREARDGLESHIDDPEAAPTLAEILKTLEKGLKE